MVYAAACAENGDFAEAVKWQKRVLADTTLRPNDLPKLREQLKLYEAKQPYRLPKPVPPRKE